MHVLIALLAAFTAVVEARVTFPYAEVLQVTDLVNNQAAFSCDNGCKVYVDRVDDALMVTQNGVFVASFTDIVGNNTYMPDGIVLPAGKNYKLQTRSMPVADFVFYVVSSKASFYGTSVYAPQEKKGVTANFQGRYFTVISRYNAIEFYAISGAYPSGYPKVFATGYDSVSDTRCTPVYQGRSQYNVEQSRPMIWSPIITFDFGFVGKHAVSANQNNGKIPYKSAVASVVYNSPGHVGCSFVGNQAYYSPVKSVQDSFMLVANSLDINARFQSLSVNEAVRLSVNNDTLDFYGTSTMKKTYGYASMDIALSWTRQTPASSWAMQLDFGKGSTMPSTPRPIATTSSAGFISLFVSTIVALAVSSLQ